MTQAIQLYNGQPEGRTKDDLHVAINIFQSAGAAAPPGFQLPPLPKDVFKEALFVCATQDRICISQCVCLVSIIHRHRNTMYRLLSTCPCHTCSLYLSASLLLIVFPMCLLFRSCFAN